MSNSKFSLRYALGVVALITVLDVGLAAAYRGLERISCLIAGDDECLPKCGGPDPYQPPFPCKP